ncbi:MAG: SseB family protein [Elusimicrobia bacterium]|nr:SseB family protein [Candidatus Obscuribacterium magneticum]
MSKAIIPPDALEALMRKVFLEKAMSPGLFWDALLKANLFVPTAKSGETLVTKTETPAPGEEFPMVLGVDSEGRHIAWLFTSPQVLKDYTEQDLPYVEIAAGQIFERFKETAYDVVLIGPEQLTLKLHPKLVSSLAEGKVPEEGDIPNMAREARVFAGPAVPAAEALEKRFSDLFQTLPEVQEAVFIQVADESFLPPEGASGADFRPAGCRLLLGLRLKLESKEEFQRVAHLIAQATEGVLGRGETMDITLINGSLKTAFEKFGKPFFKR